MSIGIGIVNVVGRSGLGGAGIAPITYLVRDQFTTDVDPLVDGAAVPGPGTRDITGTAWFALGDALRGGVAEGGALDGTERLVYEGFTRTAGRTLAAYVIPSDATDELTIGWATSTTENDPTTDGHSWVNDEGKYLVATPGQLLSLQGLQENIRPIELLVAIVQQAEGALYLLSAVAADHSAEQQDPYGIPAYPSARVLYYAGAGTTTPLYPQIQGGSTVDDDYPNHMYIADVRVVDAPELAEDDLATVADHTTKSADLGTATAGSADGIFHVSMTFDSASAIAPCGIRVRQVDSTNFLRVWTDGGATIKIQSIVGGAFNDTHFATAYTWAISAVYHFYVECRGSAVRVIVQREGTTTSVDSGWMTIAVHTTGATFGSYESSATTATWTDLVHYPHTVTLPASIREGKCPIAWVPGSDQITDTFTGSNGTTLSGKATTTGSQVWTVASGTWTIQSNKASVTAASGVTIATVPAPSDTYEVEVDFTLDNPYVAVLGGLVVMHDGATGGYVAIRPLSGARDEIELVESSDAGGFTGIAKKIDITDSYFAVGQTYNLRVQVTPQLIRVYLDDVIKLSHALSQSFGGTGVGLYDAGNYTIDWDNFVVRALTTPAGSTLDVDPPEPPEDAFPTVANVLWRYRAENEAYADGASVGTATDLSGNGRNATAAGGARPTFETGILNGKSVYRFDGSSDCLQVPAFAIGSPTVTLYVVCNKTDTTAIRVIYEHGADYNGDTDRFYLWNNTNATIDAGLKGDVGVSSFQTTGTIGATHVVIRALYDKSLATNEVTVELDGSTAGARGSNNNNASANFGSEVGNIGSRNATAAFHHGDIAEIFLISGDPSSGEKAALDAYFLSEYGV